MFTYDVLVELKETASQNLLICCCSDQNTIKYAVTCKPYRGKAAAFQHREPHPLLYHIYIISWYHGIIHEDCYCVSCIKISREMQIIAFSGRICLF